MRKHLQNNRGETIVEVLVAFLILMLFTALFTVSLRFARRASQQAQETRDTAYNLTAALYPAGGAGAAWQNDGATQDMQFTGAGGATFTIKNVQNQTCTATTDSGDSCTFSRYYKEAEGANP